jgi:hypothetical protein
MSDEEVSRLVKGKIEVGMELLVQVLEELDRFPRVEACRLVLPLTADAAGADTGRLRGEVVLLQQDQVVAAPPRQMVGDGCPGDSAADDGAGDSAADDGAIGALSHVYSGGKAE